MNGPKTERVLGAVRVRPVVVRAGRGLRVPDPLGLADVEPLAHVVACRVQAEAELLVSAPVDDALLV